jgi:hypothetical protein
MDMEEKVIAEAKSLQLEAKMTPVEKEWFELMDDIQMMVEDFIDRHE